MCPRGCQVSYAPLLKPFRVLSQLSYGPIYYELFRLSVLGNRPRNVLYYTTSRG